jgi:hypothetical protein
VHYVGITVDGPHQQNRMFSPSRPDMPGVGTPLNRFKHPDFSKEGDEATS